jgi:hypothetical protein
MASRWRGESVFAHLERRWSTVTAGDGGMIQVDLGDSRSLLRWLVVLFSWSNSGGATSWNSLGGVVVA